MVATGHGIELPFTQSTTSAKSLPATGLFSSGPYDLSARLKAHGMAGIRDDTPVWIDGTRHFGLEALAAAKK